MFHPGLWKWNHKGPVSLQLICLFHPREQSEESDLHGPIITEVVLVESSWRTAVVCKALNSNDVFFTSLTCAGCGIITSIVFWVVHEKLHRDVVRTCTINPNVFNRVMTNPASRLINHHGTSNWISSGKHATARFQNGSNSKGTQASDMPTSDQHLGSCSWPQTDSGSRKRVSNICPSSVLLLVSSFSGIEYENRCLFQMTIGQAVPPMVVMSPPDLLANRLYHTWYHQEPLQSKRKSIRDEDVSRCYPSWLGSSSISPSGFWKPLPPCEDHRPGGDWGYNNHNDYTMGTLLQGRLASRASWLLISAPRPPVIYGSYSANSLSSLSLSL